MRLLGARLARSFHHRHAMDTRRVAAVHARLVREVTSPPPQRGQLLQLAHRLERAGQDRVARAVRVVQRLGDALALLSPESVLERGYAIVTDGAGAVISDARQLAVGDAVALRFASGRARATVQTVTPADADPGT